MKQTTFIKSELTRVHRHTNHYLRGVRLSFEVFAEKHNLEKAVLWVVNKSYQFTNHSDAVKGAYDLAVKMGGI